MNINNLLLLPALVNRAMDAARAVKQGIHTVICWVEEATLIHLLALPHFAVSGYSIETTRTQDILHLLCELTLEVGVCPHCQTVSTTIKQYQERCVRDCDVWGKRTFLHFRIRRFECPDCGLRFTEELTSIGWRRRQTYRFEQGVYRHCLRCSRKETSESYHLSQSTMQEIFKKWAQQHCSQLSWKKVRVLGMDEIALKKRHKQYVLVLSDLERHCVLAVLPTR